MPCSWHAGAAGPTRALRVHSDRGSQYASGRFQAILQKYGYGGSMSRNGNCWDNAPAESCFHTLNMELSYHRRFARAQARHEIVEYLDVFYNRQRKQSTLGDRTPDEFAQRYRKAA